MTWINRLLAYLASLLQDKPLPPPVAPPAPEPPDPLPFPPDDEDDRGDAPRVDEPRTIECRPPRGQYLIDASPGTGRCGSCATRGAWQTVPDRSCYGGSQLYMDKSAAPGTVTITPRLAAAGRYEVWVGYICSHAGAREARFSVRHADGVATVTLCQYEDARGYRWRKLGAWRFNAGSAARVTLHGVPGLASASERIDCVGLRKVK